MRIKRKRKQPVGWEKTFANRRSAETLITGLYNSAATTKPRGQSPGRGPDRACPGRCPRGGLQAHEQLHRIPNPRGNANPKQEMLLYTQGWLPSKWNKWNIKLKKKNRKTACRQGWGGAAGVSGDLTARSSRGPSLGSTGRAGLGGWLHGCAHLLGSEPARCPRKRLGWCAADHMPFAPH